MSVTAFGSTVDEVQRKLNEILPLIDSGAERAKELHEQIENELTQYENSFTDVDQSLDTLQETAAALDGEIDTVRSELETGMNELGVELADAEQKAEAGLEKVTQAEEQIELLINDTGSQFDAGTTSAAVQFDAIAQNAGEMKTIVTSLRGKTEAGLNELSEEVTTFTTQWEADSATSKGSLDTLTTTVAQSHKDEVSKHFNGLNDSTVEAVTNIINLATDHETGFNEFFAAFDTDADTLVEEFKAKSQEMFANLTDYTENPCGRVLEDALENLTKEVVEALAAEMIASIAMTEVGVATTSMLSPIIPELVIAKKITGAINAVL